jgi:glycosyltransferase involved in cell wall biosynthesis
MKKIILHFSNRPYSQNPGGTETFLINLISKMPEFTHILMGEKITKVIADKTSCQFVEIANYHGKVSSSKDRIKQIFLFPFTCLISIWQIIRYFKIFAKADIISYSTGSRNSLLNLAPILMLIFPKKRQVYIHHGSIPTAKFYHHKLFKPLFVWTWNSVENIFICNSQRQLFVDYGLKGGEMIYNAVDIIPQTFERKNTIFKLLYVGRLIKEKGILDIWQALEILDKKDIKLEFDILGDGPEKAFLELNKNQFKNIKVNIWGNQKPNEYYKQADGLILPSYSEGFALTPMEGMCFGLPTICTKIPPLLEVSAKFPELAVETNSPSQIASKIELVIQNQSHYGSIAYQQMLNKEILDKFTIQDQIQKYTNFYNK